MMNKTPFFWSVRRAVVTAFLIWLGLQRIALAQDSTHVVDLFVADINKSKGPELKEAARPAPKRNRAGQAVTKFDQERHDYTGSLDDAAINVRMSIYGEVHGDLYFLRSPDRLYAIKGRNSREGLLDLTLLSDGVAVAKGEVHRDTSLKKVVHWNGALRDENGGSHRFFLGRDLTPDVPIVTPSNVDAFDALVAQGIERYEGTVTDARGMIAQSVFKLLITNSKCYGFYYQKYPNGKTSAILGLHGDNTPAELFLRESDSDGISAEFHLKKRLTADEIIWEGTLRNVRDNAETKSVVFSRPRKA